MLTTMLRSIKELYGYEVRSTDALIGKVREFYLDDEKWVVRSIGIIGGILLPAELLEETDPQQRAFFLQLNAAAIREKLENRSENSQLRAARRLFGLLMFARNGVIGKVEDLVVNDADLSVRYFVVDAPVHGQKFVISPWWIQEIDWEYGEIRLRFGLERVLRSPKFDFQMPVSREYEAALHEYYDKQTYFA